MDDAILQDLAFAALFAEAAGVDHGGTDAARGAVGYAIQHALGSDTEGGDIGGFRQVGDRRIAAPAAHLLVARINGIDAARVAEAFEPVEQRPSDGRAFGGTDDRNRAWVQQTIKPHALRFSD
jgi:hypothetical protein